MARQAIHNPTHFIHSTVITNGLVIKWNTNNIPPQCGMIIIFKINLCTLISFVDNTPMCTRVLYRVFF